MNINNTIWKYYLIIKLLKKKNKLYKILFLNKEKREEVSR